MLASAALGVWLMAAPAVLGYDGAARIVHLIVGPVAAAAAVIAMSEVTRSVRWVNLVTGLWLVLTCWMPGSGTAATVSALISGAALAALATVEGRRRQRLGGGWSVLWRGRDA